MVYEHKLMFLETDATLPLAYMPPPPARAMIPSPRDPLAASKLVAHASAI